MEARRVDLRLGQGRNAGFTDRYPDLVTSKGTNQLRPEQAVDISDDEPRDLARSALTD